MRIQQLQLLVALAETGSLRAAAKQLHVTQPALTKALRQLEDEFSTTLVTRTPKGARLTETGEILRARAAAVLREVDRAKQEVAWQTRKEQATVVISVSPGAAMTLIPGALKRLHDRWPDVLVSIIDAVYPLSHALVRSGKVELAIGPLPAEGVDNDLYTTPLGEARTILVTRNTSKYASSTTKEDLTQASWILAGPKDGPGDPQRLTFQLGEGFSPRIVAQCESYLSVLAILPSIDAIALVPESIFHQYGTAVGLSQVTVNVSQLLPKVMIHTVWLADTTLTAPAAGLLDAIKQETAYKTGGV
ncbi:MAG TPA: hypothetical protein DE179_07880 [Oceanospirillaceae bacterium]|nr:hypothetical protein [Oceanospirillaceae bacterium]